MADNQPSLIIRAQIWSDQGKIWTVRDANIPRVDKINEDEPALITVRYMQLFIFPLKLECRLHVLTFERIVCMEAKNTLERSNPVQPTDVSRK